MRERLRLRLEISRSDTGTMQHRVNSRALSLVPGVERAARGAPATAA